MPAMMFGGASKMTAQTPKPAAAPVQVIGGGAARPPSYKKPAYKPPARPGGVIAAKVPSALPKSAGAGSVIAPKSPAFLPPPKLAKKADWGPWQTPPEMNEGYGGVDSGNFPESGPSSSMVAEADAGAHGSKGALFNWWDIWGDVDPSTIHAEGGPTYGDPPAPGSAAYNAGEGAAVIPTSASGGSFFGGSSSGYGRSFDDYSEDAPSSPRGMAQPTPPPASGPSSTTLAIGAGVVALGIVAYLKGWI